MTGRLAFAPKMVHNRLFYKASSKFDQAYKASSGLWASHFHFH